MNRIIGSVLSIFLLTVGAQATLPHWSRSVPMDSANPLTIYTGGIQTTGWQYVRAVASSTISSFVRDSIVYDDTCSISAQTGSKIYSTVGYPLVIKLNGVLHTPPIHNRSTIKWE